MLERFCFNALLLVSAACANAPPPASQSARDPSNPAAEETPVSAPQVSSAPAPAASSAPVVYACPMHPEVTATEPGHHCPKCGMELVPRREPR